MKDKTKENRKINFRFFITDPTDGTLYSRKSITQSENVYEFWMPRIGEKVDIQGLWGIVRDVYYFDGKNAFASCVDVIVEVMMPFEKYKHEFLDGLEKDEWKKQELSEYSPLYYTFKKQSN